MRPHWLIKILALVLLGVAVLAGGIVVFSRDLIAFGAQRYGYGVVASDISLDLDGGRIRRVATPFGYVLEDISWRWRSGEKPLFPLTPDVHIVRLNTILPETVIIGPPVPKRDLNPVALFDLLRSLSLPAGRLAIDHLVIGNGEFALVINSPGDRALEIKISQMSLYVAETKISGSLDLDWDGQNIVCAGTFDARFDTPRPLLGKRISVKPSCHTGQRPLIRLEIIPQGLAREEAGWRKIMITIPITDKRPDQIVFDLSDSPVLPPVVGDVIVKDIEKSWLDINIKPITGNFIDQPFSASKVHVVWRGQKIDIGALAADWGAEGQITFAPMTYDLRNQSVAGKVTVTRINSAPILARWPIKGLYFEGIFDGEVPFCIERNIITLNKGHLNANNGIVRYVADTLVEGQLSESGGGIALAALGDFHFDNLKITLDGVQGANQTVEMTLSGRNPALYDGYPVVLRVNLSGALENLLREGRATMSLPDRLKLEQQQRKNSVPSKSHLMEKKL